MNLIQEIHWQTARNAFVKTDPELSAIIDELSPDKSLPLLKITYPFGTKILENNTFYAPNNNETFLPLAHPKTPKMLQEQLGYNSCPLGLITSQHGVEIFYETENRLLSVAFFDQGLHLGIWELFATPIPITMTAGARSVFLTPKITDSSSHKKLKKFGVHSPPPTNLFEHWPIFTELSQHPNFGEYWASEIIFFPDKWIEKIKNDPSWLKLKFYILNRAWQHSEFQRNQGLCNVIWDAYSNILTKKRIKPPSYVINIFKHLLFVTTGAIPAFKPFTGDETCGPFDKIIQIYLEEYGLKTYLPTLMHPYHFRSNNSTDPVYFSLQIPTYLDASPQSRDSVSAKADLESLIWLIDKFNYELNSHNFGLENMPILSNYSNINLDFFHSEANEKEPVKPTIQLPSFDNNLLYSSKGKHGDRKFAERSSFFRGCVKISVK